MMIFEDSISQENEQSRQMVIMTLSGCLLAKNNKVQVTSLSLVLEYLKTYGSQSMDSMTTFLQKTEAL